MDANHQVEFLRADVARFCADLEGLAPALRLARLVELRQTIDAAVDAAVLEAMTAAAAEGWGLRRIARAVGVSHEQVRQQLAGAAVATAGAADG